MGMVTLSEVTRARDNVCKAFGVYEAQMKLYLRRTDLTDIQRKEIEWDQERTTKAFNQFVWTKGDPTS